jgi:hypothetical protein
MNDLRQKYELKGTGKRHKRGGMRQENVKIVCLGRNKQEYNHVWDGIIRNIIKDAPQVSWLISDDVMG